MIMIQNNWFIDPLKPWLGVHRRISIECILPMGSWSNVREIIASTPQEDMLRRVFFPKVTVACACCNVEIVRTVADMKKHEKKGYAYTTCSHRCSQIMTNLAAGKMGQKCTVCGKKIHKNNRQCSPECKAEALRLKGLRNRKNMGMFTCLVCGTQKPRRTLAHNQQFCSVDCKDDSHAVMMRGQNNPGWRNGVNSKRYDKGIRRAYKMAREIVQNLDHGKCVACNSADRLHCHHIDHNSTNNRLENLVTLCQSCHMKHHAAERSKYMKSPFPWLSEYAKVRTFSTFKSQEHDASSRMEFLSITASS